MLARDLFKRVPERVLKGDARLVASDADGVFDDRRFHHSSLLPIRLLGAPKHLGAVLAAQPGGVVRSMLTRGERAMAASWRPRGNTLVSAESI